MMLMGIIGHPHFKKYLSYCFAYLFQGALVIGLGPLIPYISEETGKIQTDYLIYFLARGFAFILSAFSVKYIQKIITYHQAIAFGAIVGGFFAILFGLTFNINICTFFMFLSSFGLLYIEVFNNVATIQIFGKQNLANWLQCLHACFGLGGLIGPFIIYMLEFNGFPTIGFLLIIVGIIIFKTPSPEVKQTDVLLQNIKSQSEYQDKSNLQQKQEQFSYVSSYCTFFMCLSFLTIVGQEATYASWIPSYAVLKGFSTKQHATLYSSLYWISITVSRLIFLFVPGKSSTKMFYLTIGGAICTTLCLFCILTINSELGLVGCSITLGFCNSALFALLLSVPSQFSFRISATQSSYLMLFGGIGQGTVSVGTGYFMKAIGYQMLFFVIILGNIVAMLINLKMCKLLKKQTEQLPESKSTELEYMNDYAKLG